MALPLKSTCYNCNGTGVYDGLPCGTCGGDGILQTLGVVDDATLQVAFTDLSSKVDTAIGSIKELSEICNKILEIIGSGK